VKRVLVVDDDVDILEGIALLLESEGFCVLTTQRGEEVYRRINEFHPDLVLLDVLMSGSDGRVICKKLKSTDKTKQMPVLLISADPTAKYGSVRSGANDFLAKPFNTEELIKKVRKYTLGDN